MELNCIVLYLGMFFFQMNNNDIIQQPTLYEYITDIEGEHIYYFIRMILVTYQ